MIAVAIQPPVTYAIQAPLEHLLRYRSVRLKASGDFILWQPIKEGFSNVILMLNEVNRNLVKMTKDQLLKFQTELNNVQKTFETKSTTLSLDGGNVIFMEELYVRKKVAEMWRLVDNILGRINQLLNAEDPDESSEEYKEVLSDIIDESIATSSRIGGRQSLMALFD